MFSITPKKMAVDEENIGLKWVIGLGTWMEMEGGS